jgi:hypothetical protein
MPLERYRSLGAAQRHRFGEGDLGSRPPDFNFGLPFSTTPPAQGAQGEPASPAPAAVEPPPAPQQGDPNQAEPTSGQQNNNGEGGSNGSGRNP